MSCIRFPFKTLYPFFVALESAVLTQCWKLKIGDVLETIFRVNFCVINQEIMGVLIKDRSSNARLSDSTYTIDYYISQKYGTEKSRSPIRLVSNRDGLYSNWYLKASKMHNRLPSQAAELNRNIANVVTFTDYIWRHYFLL